MRKPLSADALHAQRVRAFWKKVQKTNESTCWLWLGPVNRSGYGFFRGNSLKDRGWYYTAHRFAYEIARGPIPSGKGHHGTVIAHRCDNRRCVNPAHLFACTQAENLRDCLEKKRGNKAAGERAGRAKLTENAVRAIRKLIEDDVDRQTLARAFGVTPQTIADIASLKSWTKSPTAIVGPLAIAEAPREYNNKPNSGSFRPGSKGNPGPKPEMRTTDYDKIASMLDSGRTIREIARLCDTTHTTVRRVALQAGKTAATPFKRLSVEDRARIRTLKETGISNQVIADQLGISQASVSRTLTAAGST